MYRAHSGGQDDKEREREYTKGSLNSWGCLSYLEGIFREGWVVGEWEKKVLERGLYRNERGSGQ